MSSVYLIAKVNLINRMDLTDEKVLWFCNRPVSQAPYTGAETVDGMYATLVEANGLDLQIANDGMPVSASGSIIISDSPGKFGANRRLVDYLTRYECVNRDIEIFAFEFAPGVLPSWDDVADNTASPIWAGQMTSWEKSLSDSEEEEITINTQGISLKRESFYTVLNKTLTDDPSALGQALPLVIDISDFSPSLGLPAVIGTQVKGYSSGALFDPVRYYFASELTDTVSTVNVFKYLFPDPWTDLHCPYIRDLLGHYVPIAGPDASPVYVGDASPGTTTVSTASGGIEFAIKGPTVTDGMIILGGRMSFEGIGSAATPPGELLFNLYYNQSTGGELPDESKPIATATVAKSQYYAQLATSTDFWIEFRFEQPFVYSSEGPFSPTIRDQLWLSFTHTEYSAGTDFLPCGSVTRERRRRSGGSAKSWSGLGSINCPNIALYVAGVDILSTTTQTERTGKEAIYLEIDTGTTPTGQPVPDVSKLDVVIATPGVRDTGGAITAIPGAGIGLIETALSLLQRKWTKGSGWLPGSYPIDLTDFQTERNLATGNYRRYISGYLPGTATSENYIQTIVKECAAKLVPKGNSLAIWLWGAEYQTAFVFTDENCLVEEISCDDASTVVNAISLIYQPSLLAYNSSSTPGGSYNKGVFDYTSFEIAEDQEILSISGDSRTIYGTNQNNEEQVRFLFGEESARAYARYLISSFDAPNRTVTFSTLYSADRDIGLANVVEVLSTALPSFFGSGGKPKDITYDDEPVNLTGEGPILRAQRYRIHLTGKTYRYDDSGFRIVYTGRVIGRYHKFDPT